MAKINPIKTRQEAEKAEKAGKLEQAIPLYRMLLEDNPRDWNTINKIGDLFAKIGKMREAGDEYAKVAEFYAKDGFHLKAIAIWKKINKLDPTVLEPYAKLADLYAKQGLVMEAKGQFQIVADDQLKRGRMKEAAETLRRMVEIDPADLKTRSRLADIYTKEGSTARAVGEYVAISDELNLKGHPAEAIQVLEKGLKIDTGITVKAHLGRVHLAQRSYEKAIAYLEEVTAQEATPETLMQLGQAYLGAKRVPDAQSTLESVIEKNPSMQEARVILVQIYAIQGRADDAYDTLLPLVEQLLLKRDAERAANMLLQITARSPHHVRTLQKLVEVARIRQNDRAIVASLRNLLAAHTAAGSDRAAEDTAQQLVDVEPDNEEFKATLAALKAKKAAPVLSGPAKVAVERKSAADMTLPPPSVAHGTSELDGLSFDTGAVVRPEGLRAESPADSPSDREFIEEHLAESRVFRKYGLLDKAEEQVDLVLARYPNIFDGRFEKKEIFKETDRVEEAARECLWLSGVAAGEGNESLATMLRDEALGLWPALADEMEPPAQEAPVEPPFDIDAAAAPELSLESPEALTSGFEALAEPEAGASFPGEVDLLTESPVSEAFTSEPVTEPEPFADAAPEPALATDDEEEDLNIGMGLGVPDDAASSPLEAFGASVEDAPSLESFGAETPSEMEAAAELPFHEAPAAEPSLESETEAAAEAAALAAGFGDFADTQPPDEIPADASPVDDGMSVEPSTDELAADEGSELGGDLDLGLPTPLSRPDARGPVADPEVLKAIEEVDSYVALGFIEDARDALRDAITRFPGDALLAERASGLGLDLSAPSPVPAPAAPAAPPVVAPALAPAPPPLDLPPAPPAPAAMENDLLSGLAFDDLQAPAEVSPPGLNMRVAEAAPVADSGGIDLGAELSALFDAQPALEEAPIDTSRASSFEDQSLQDVFDAFKKGVDSQLGEGDYDTRYNLGIAYKEMGLLDEAIAEFQLAAKDPRRSLECSSMIGICFMEKGMADVAIQWYERGLQVPGRAAEEYRGLRYDLATAQEAVGDLQKAKATFGDLVREDPAFRDASSRLRDLQSRA